MSDTPDPNDFTGDADIDDQLEERNRFSETLTQNGFPDTLVLRRSKGKEVMGDDLLPIIDCLQEEDVDTFLDIAESLDRDSVAVREDLHRLAELDVVEYEEGTNRPVLKHAYVVVEPIC